MALEPGIAALTSLYSLNMGATEIAIRFAVIPNARRSMRTSALPIIELAASLAKSKHRLKTGSLNLLSSEFHAIAPWPAQRFSTSLVGLDSCGLSAEQQQIFANAGLHNLNTSDRSVFFRSRVDAGHDGESARFEGRGMICCCSASAERRRQMFGAELLPDIFTVSDRSPGGEADQIGLP